jgi:hypothetical protein
MPMATALIQGTLVHPATGTRGRAVQSRRAGGSNKVGISWMSGL